MSKRQPTRAEQLRRHRQIFLYARDHDLSLVAAELSLLREEREARLARRRAVQGCGRAIAPDRLQKLDGGALRPIPDNAPWMMRD